MRTYGCKGPKTDVRDFKVDSTKAGVINFPASFEIKNRPRVKNQGNINSCVAHVASEILEYYAKNSVKLSTNFIYGIERQFCGEEEPGMYLIDACKIVKEYGDMLENDCPGNTEVPLSSIQAEREILDEQKMEKAKNYKIDSYYACSNINDIKYALMTYGPVMGCIMWYNDFRMVSRDAEIQFDENSDGGYHAIMIYGWNEKGFLIQNSWGPVFGRNGCFILPYKYKIAEARVLIDDPTVGNPACLVKKSTSSFYKIINFIKRKLYIPFIFSRKDKNS